MKFLVITHVDHVKEGNNYLAYGPYVREMNIWFKHVEQVEIVAPIVIRQRTNIDISYRHNNLSFSRIPFVEFTSISEVFKSVFKLPLICCRLIKACKRADHIHLRCPGNIGAIGCIVQILFPKKTKTVKYAGNWDPKAKQPISYRFQKRILKNTFLTKNTKVLVYGKWKNQTKNIVSFFTATFRKEEIDIVKTRDYTKQLNFLFIGSLVKGKRPLFAIKIIQALLKKEINVSLDIYGDGILKENLKKFVIENELESIIKFHGNQSKEIIKEKLKESHFLILASKSEGWPKVVAESMFYGVIPISTNVSCVAYMLDNDIRGVLIEPYLDEAILKLIKVIKTRNLNEMSRLGVEWSQKFTLDYFETEIKKLLH